MVTGAKAFGIQARIISSQEAKELFPLLNENNIQGAIYSSVDGVIDPTMLINALTKSARDNGCQVFYKYGLQSLKIKTKEDETTKIV